MVCAHAIMHLNRKQNKIKKPPLRQQERSLEYYTVPRHDIIIPEQEYYITFHRHRVGVIFIRKITWPHTYTKER